MSKVNITLTTRGTLNAEAFAKFIIRESEKEMAGERRKDSQPTNYDRDRVIIPDKLDTVNNRL